MYALSCYRTTQLVLTLCALPWSHMLLVRAALLVLHISDFETSATRNDQVPEAFSSLIARIVAQIPNPPEPSLLLRKRIQIGKALAENKSFRAALFDMS